METLLLNVTRYLSTQNNQLDRNIATLLTFANFCNVEQSTSYSDRWNCFWATAVLEVPYEIEQSFTPEVLNRITEVLQKFKPRDWEIDFSDTVVQLKLERVYDNWQEDILRNIAQEGLNNQAFFNSSNHPMCEYNGLRFRSQAERRVMIEFDQRHDVLVFPLPAAVCAGEIKEPDFFVVKNGKGAILEIVSDQYHVSVVNEANRTQWYQNHNLQIRSYSASDAYNNSVQVVNDFIVWLENQN